LAVTGVKREVEVIAVDSLSAGPGTGPIGSRQAVMLSGALLGAADRIAEKLRKVAGVILEANADDIELFNGQLRVKGSPEKTLPLQRVVTVMLTRADLLPPGVVGNPRRVTRTIRRIANYRMRRDAAASI
jgi:CO/xanthine dehydrogenase Mo-binding subunit